MHKPDRDRTVVKKHSFVLLARYGSKVSDSINNVVDSISLADLLKAAEKEDGQMMNIFEE